MLHFQVLIGIAAAFVGFHCLRKAFSEDIDGAKGDAAFAGYLLGLFASLIVGTLLIIAIGLQPTSLL